MQFPESWLREFCNPPLNSQQLADTLTMAGLEVEDIQAVAPPFTQVVVGAIVAAAPHPNADRLRVCQVDVGAAQPLHIVCGAPNARVGIKVPCALVGAVLPPSGTGQPLQIRLGQLRGVESQGMLCSARELGLSEDQSGLLELAATAEVGQCLRAHLQLDDQLFTLKLTPNLAHCLSVYGIARELSALTGAPLLTPSFPVLQTQHTDVLPVQVQAPDLCGRFTGRIVRHLNAKAPTPAWMVQRLERCGQRSVSALVDISNYVMFELGRPSHIFDLERIHGGLQVRWGRDGEQLELLNGQTVTLDASVGVIADEQAVESLAGIMGGAATAVSDDTRHVFVEAAFWWPTAVAGRSRRFNFSTDAGHRFERGVDPSNTREHVERITALIVQICGGEVGPIDDHVLSLPPAQAVSLRVARAAKVIGMPLTQAQCVDALRRLNLPLTEGAGVVSVTPPPYRFDLQIEEDLIEEVVRLIGFEHLPQTPPQAPITAKLRPENRRGAFQLRRQLAQMGYQETINYSFVPERWEQDYAGATDPIRLLNPIASHLSVMRSSLLGSLLAVLKHNTDRKAERARIFELGRVFAKDARVPDTDTTVAGIAQPMRVAGLAYGALAEAQWGLAARAVDFFDIKGEVQALLAPRQARFEPLSSLSSQVYPALHPGRSALVWVDGVQIGVLGELHPRWRQLEGWTQAPLLFELDLAAVLQHPLPQTLPISRHQPVERDVAVVVKDSITHAALMAAVHAAPTQGWLKQAVLFDVYRPKPGNSAVDSGSATPSGLGADEKSLAVRLTLERHDANLTDADIDSVVQAVLAELAQRLGARLR